MRDLIVSVPDHCFSIYFATINRAWDSTLNKILNVDNLDREIEVTR